MKILLLNPPNWTNCQHHFTFNPNLGLPYIAGMLKRAGQDVLTVDAEFLKWTQSQLRELLVSDTCRDLTTVGVHACSFSYAGVLESVASIKAVRPDVFVSVGGPHATAVPLEVLAETGADQIVVGECEGNVVDLLAGSRPVGIQRGVPLPTLDDLPRPDWEGYRPHLTEYHDHPGNLAQPESVVMWDRGCPHKCVFCNHPVFGGQKTRRRSPEHILDELQWLYHEYGIRGLFVYSDELIGMDRGQNAWLQEISEGMIRLGLDYKWRCQGRCAPHLIEPETLRVMKRAGCGTVMWGGESGSQRVLDENCKGIRVDGIERVMQMTADAGIRNFGFFMVGNLGEHTEDLEQTHRLVCNLKRKNLLHDLQVSITTPAKGSRLWTMCDENGWLRADSDAPGGRPMYDVRWDHPYLSADEIHHWRDKIACAN